MSEASSERKMEVETLKKPKFLGFFITEANFSLLYVHFSTNIYYLCSQNYTLFILWKRKS